MLKKILVNLFSYLIKYSIFDKIFSVIKNIDKIKSIEVGEKKKIFFIDKNWITRFRIETFFQKNQENP